jgi:hypothetical protein
VEGKQLIFLCGLHRSGTSLLHEIIRSHPEVSGFENTGVPEDEGQHLQSVYQPAVKFGGPGRFAFDSGSRMDESHLLATDTSAKTIFDQWRPYFDMSCQYLVEKSPPNIIRSRFLQKLFPGSKFIFILRHPLAVSYATRKWSETAIQTLFEHYILAHEIMLRDLPFLKSTHIMKYEDLVADPQDAFNSICDFLGLSPVDVKHEVKPDVNDKYFRMWENERKDAAITGLESLEQLYEKKINQLGYSFMG